jgi:signal transduction histidine kinase/ActR/RegA family two-component response regulator
MNNPGRGTDVVGAAPAWRGDHRANHVPHTAPPLERLAKTIVSSDRVEDLLPELAQRFAEAVSADLVVIRLREGDRLVTRAALGFSEGSGEVDHTHPVDLIEQRAIDSAPIRLDPSGDGDALISAAITAEQIRTIQVLPLRASGRFEGLVLLGWRSELDLPAEHLHLLTSLAAPVGPALVRLRAIAERDAALVAAERALALRDEILGVVAHDLRNPLNVITTATELLQRRTTDPAQRRHLERITRSVQRADRMVRDLLEVNAIEGHGMKLDRRRVEVVEVVLTAIESQQVLAASAQVMLATDLSPSLPAVDCDEQRIQEVLENLISNAIKFNQPGGSVEIGATITKGEVRLWVRDSGIGISPEHLPHVFDRFWQGVKRDRRGTGLGLAICRAIIDAHGGRIWADSEPGSGTTLSFTLPVADQPVVAPVVAPASILLVDDRPENLVALGAILADPRYRLITAASGEEALREALREDFAVALIDVAMPGMDGLEVAGHLKKLSRYRDVPILFVTAFGDDPEEIHRAYAAGGADYLVKPLDPEVVRKKVAVFVELSRRQRAETT